MAGNYYADEAEKVVKKLLPKFVEKYESQHNFKLPKIEIVEITGQPHNIWRVMSDGEKPSFNYVGVKVEVDVKDGRIGRVKKLITNTVEKVLDSLGYEFNEIYVEFIRTSDLDKEKIEKLEGLIHKLLLGDRMHKGWYSLPYSDSYDDGVDWIVRVLPYQIQLSPSTVNNLNVNENCIYEVKIVLMVESIFVGSEENNEWEKVYGQHDLPEHSWDEIQDNVHKKIKDFMPNICDSSIEFKFMPRYR
jgi:hypothetical protein